MHEPKTRWWGRGWCSTLGGCCALVGAAACYGSPATADDPEGASAEGSGGEGPIMQGGSSGAASAGGPPLAGGPGAIAGTGGAAGNAGIGGHAGIGGTSTGGAGGCPPPAPQECNATICPMGLPPEATTCAPDGNECGCDGGGSGSGAGTAGAAGGTAGTSGTCDPARNGLCVRVHRPAQFGVGGPGTQHNVCVYDLCASDADCEDGLRCISGSAVPVCSSACRFDSECTRDCGGRCAPALTPSHAAPEANYAAARCVYEGKCGESSCAGCVDLTGLDASQFAAGAHLCR
jgi:hypothetical protein